jgi:GNAT superfamily N-acetyltransferase
MKSTPSLQSLSLIRADLLSIEELAAAFNHTFSGYQVPITQTAASLQSMIEVDDIQLRSSLVVRDTGGEDVGIGLLAVRGSRGWVGGMAVAPTWRGRGVGTWLIAEVLDQASALALEMVELEVLEENAAAHRLYQQAGFADLRLLTVFGGRLALPAPALGSPVIADQTASITPIKAEDALRRFEALHQVSAAWQRQRAALLHMIPRLDGLAFSRTNDPDGAAAVEAYLLSARSGEGYVVMDFGSSAPSQDERVTQAKLMLQQLLHTSPEAPLHVINVPPGDALGNALASLGCPIMLRQHEMRIRLPQGRVPRPGPSAEEPGENA